MTFSSDRGRIVPPNLDDRTWQDLVDQMRALIPQYTPAWTDNNPSDVGITLIELFAWLAESVIYRLNQVPDQNYAAFLNLLGITRNPAIPAQTYLTFTSGAGPVLVPTGTQAAVPPAGTTTPQIVFETDEDVRVLPVALASAVLIGPYPAAATTGLYTDVTSTLVGPPAARMLLTLPAGQAMQLCLGFDQPTTEPVQLAIRLYTPGPDPGQVTVSLVYSQAADEPLAWPPVPGVQETTGGLQHDGTIQATVPGDWAGQQPTAGPGARPGSGWSTVTARARLGRDDRPAVLARAARGQHRVEPGGHRRRPDPVQRGRGADRPDRAGSRGPRGQHGQPFQVFQLAKCPLYRRPDLASPYGDLVVQAGAQPGPTPSDWTQWTLVDDFPAGAGTSYRLDPVTGEIMFGNFDDRSGQGHGSIPPAGTRIRALSYRYVAGGAAGNVAANQVTAPVTLPTGITKVTNRGPAQDGTDEEPIDATLRRAPEELKVRYRAVTADDYEFLTREARSDIAICGCLLPRAHATADQGNPPAWQKGDPWSYGGILRAPGTVNLVIVPDQGPDVARPEPTREQLGEVQAYLDQRRDMTALLQVLGPRYLPVIAAVNFVVWQEAINAGADPAAITADLRQRLTGFLHPVHGGADGTGWQLGQSVFAANVFQAIMLPRTSATSRTSQIRPDIPAYHFPPLNPGGTATNFNPLERPLALSGPGPVVQVADYELVCSADPAEHQITPSTQSQPEASHGTERIPALPATRALAGRPGPARAFLSATCCGSSRRC